MLACASMRRRRWSTVGGAVRERPLTTSTHLLMAAQAAIHNR
jgi:hypothetical protein